MNIPQFCHNLAVPVSVTIVNHGKSWRRVDLKGFYHFWLNVSPVLRVSIVQKVSAISSGFKLVKITRHLICGLGELCCTELECFSLDLTALLTGRVIDMVSE